MRKHFFILIVFSIIIILTACSINPEQKALTKIKELLDNSDYENILIYKGESPNWKVNGIIEYTDIWKKDKGGKYQYRMKLKRNWILVYKGDSKQIEKNLIHVLFQSPHRKYSFGVHRHKDKIFYHTEKRSGGLASRGEKDWEYNVVLTWSEEKNNVKKENIPLKLEIHRKNTEMKLQ